MVCPGPSSLARAVTAAATLMPEVLPSSRPFLAQQPIDEAHGLGVLMRSASSIGAPSRFAVTRPVPMPSVIDEPPSDLELSVLDVVIERAAGRVDQHDARRAGLGLEVFARLPPASPRYRWRRKTRRLFRRFAPDLGPRGFEVGRRDWPCCRIGWPRSHSAARPPGVRRPSGTDSGCCTEPRAPCAAPRPATSMI